MREGTVSNLIKPEEVKKWKSGDIITIKAGTGKGKSHFIKNRLYASAKLEGKKILLLVHRVNCRDQFKMELEETNKTDVIDLRTYQSIEAIHRKGGAFNFNKYNYIVCDEFHYFISDASFNKTTDISLREILKQEKPIKVLMSATGEYMSRYIKNTKKKDVISYEMDIDYDYIDELFFYTNDKKVGELIKMFIENGESAIFFIQSAKKAYEFHREFKDDTIYNCSEGNENGYYKYVNENKIKTLLKGEGFRYLGEKILITTTTMDAGVNITDTDVKHIVLDVEDGESLIQCLGRRRISNEVEDDSITVYIKDINNNQLGGRITQLSERTERAKYFRDNGDLAYTRKYGRDPDTHAIVYEDVNNDGTGTVKRLNELMFCKATIDCYNTEEMIKIKYPNYISNLLGIGYTNLDEIEERENLEDYLEGIIGVKLYKDQQEELKKTFRKNGLNSRTVGFNTINGNIRDRGFDYILTKGKRGKYKDSKGEWKNELSHWIMEEIE